MVRRTDNSNPRRRGTALVLVVGLVAAVAVLGLAYIESNGVDVQSSFNLAHQSRARYLAESGVEHAMYWLSQADPPGANADGYWPGATGQQIDSTNDYYSVTVSRISGTTNQYKIVSTGCRVGGSTALSYRVTAEVTVSGQSTFSLPYAMHVEGFSWPGPGLTFNGNVHCNNSLINAARVNGNLSASGFLMLSVTPTGTAKGWQSKVEFPAVAGSQYQSYRLDEQTHTAVTWESEVLDNGFGQAGPGNGNNATWHVTGDNPAGVLVVTNSGGKLSIGDNADFTGTIVFDGDLYLDGNNVKLTAASGFPALVVSGDLYLKGRNNEAVINGAVIVGGTLHTDGDTSSHDLTVNGPVHLAGGLVFWDTVGDIVINYTQERSWLYDYTGSGAPRGGTVTLDSWLDH